MNQELSRYQIAVEHPEVSGFEHLDMLLVRDKLARQKANMGPAERARLAAADRRLLQQVHSFYAELARVVDLPAERQHRKPEPERWWWYLDVLAALPAVPPIEHTSEPVPSA